MKMTIDIVPAHWREYVGTRPPLADPRDRAMSLAFSLIAECMAPPNSPHWRMARNGMLLCDETESFIYDNDYGFIEEPYHPGSKPILEAFLASFIHDGMTDREKVLAILAHMQDDQMPNRFGHVPGFLYGESDEQTLLKGGGHCSCRGRLMSALCQVLGIQGRPLMFWVIPDPDRSMGFIGGHTVMEAYIDGQWAFMDPMPGLYCVKPDGNLASIRDIRENPSMLKDTNKPLIDSVNARQKSVDGEPFIDNYIHRYFQKRCPTLISRHDVNTPYLGAWNWATPEFRERQKRDHRFLKEFTAGLASEGRLTDEVYAMTGRQFREHFKLTELELTIPRDVFPPASRAASAMSFAESR